MNNVMMLPTTTLPLPPLPEDIEKITSEPRRQGAKHAQRLLRYLDNARSSLEARGEALQWTIEEMVMERAARPSTTDAFFEGVLSALGAAQSALRARMVKVRNLRTIATQCAAKAEKERDRRLSSARARREEAEALELEAAREYERLSSYAQQQEGNALEAEVWTMADARFA